VIVVVIQFAFGKVFCRSELLD